MMAQVGDIYHGFFEPDDPGWLVLRLSVMGVLGLVGFRVGLWLHGSVLRDTFKLTMFG